ncbi:MAG: glycosyltransferase family 4 protein [Planctomycetes bacterium]|nr:glycosyltransferase family 4 protein [Planctomycetota bacterium]
MYVVPHGIDVEGPRDAAARASFGVPPGVPVVVHVAGVRHEKGFPEVFDVIDAARATVPSLQYVHVGPVLDGALVPVSDAWFASRPWAFRLGSLTRDRVLDVIAGATCTLHASTTEGFSNALLESMALGVAPIARDIPASRAAVDDGVNGLLFRDDVEAVNRLVRVITDTRLRARLGSAARVSVATRFSPEAETQRYLDVYRGARDGRR